LLGTKLQPAFHPFSICHLAALSTDHRVAIGAFFSILDLLSSADDRVLNGAKKNFINHTFDYE
jgi:hypothetical protein